MVMACDWFGDGEVFVVDIPLACCALESQSAAGSRPRLEVASLPAGARVVVTLSGTLTAPMVPAIRHALDQVPGATVVAFGACACVGGPYWDSYAVVKGGEEMVPVDHFIAGCPPPPSALDEYLEGLRG